MSKPIKIKIVFFKIYCPTIVRAYGIFVKQRCGKIKKGVKVKVICMKKKIIPIFKNLFVKKQSPTPTSQIANSFIDTNGGIKEKNECFIIFVLNTSAEDIAGKNFSAHTK